MLDDAEDAFEIAVVFAHLSLDCFDLASQVLGVCQGAGASSAQFRATDDAPIAAAFYNLKRMPQPEPITEETGREIVINRAIEVIGDEKEAMRWLGTPVPALDYATPISLLNNSEGKTAVLNVLTQLEHGVL